MARVFLIVGSLAMLSACNTQQMICPAYQSSFIHDKEAVKKKFSYFESDSVPKVYTASKNQYLIAVPESYRKKYKRMQTVEMTPVYPVTSDSLKKQDEFALAEVDMSDSAAMALAAQPGDSTYAITKTKEKYNLDQDLYMWYFREVLVLPDVRAAIEKKNAPPEGKSTQGAKKEKKGIKGFFQNLFKKKPKADSTQVANPATTGVDSPPAPEKKKGGLFKKKKSPDPQPAEKKEGDGFQ